MSNYAGYVKPRTIALCLPGETFSSAWVSYYAQLQAQLQSAGWLVINLFSYSSNVYVTRSCLADAVLKCQPKPDYVLWLDDDNLLTYPQLLQMMNSLMSPQVDAVAAWAWIQPDVHTMPRPMVSCGRLDDAGRCVPYTHEQLMSVNGLIEVDYTGFPAILMTYDLLAEVGPRAFLPMLNPHHEYGISGEDTSFCVRAREAGFRIFADPRVHVPHLKLRAAAPPGFEGGLPVPTQAQPAQPARPTELVAA